MDRGGRLSFTNTLVLTGVLMLYVLYDAGFRFWIAQSDLKPLNAAILRDPRLPQHSTESALAFEAAAETTDTPSLQNCLQESLPWRRVVTGESAAAGEGGPEATPRRTAASLAAIPMAAVIVESSWLSADQTGVSLTYAQRLLEGYRYALLTGAPWLLVAGTEEETAVGLQHLRRLHNPAEALFGAAAMRRWPARLARMADPIRESMADYETLGAWMHAAATHAIPSFAASTLPTNVATDLWQSPDAESPSRVPAHGLDGVDGTLGAALHHLLSHAALAQTEAGRQQSRPPALVLAAEWLQRSEVERRSAQRSTSRVTVHAAGGAYEDEEDEGGAEAATSAGAGAAHRHRHGPSTFSWEAPRVLELTVNHTQQRVHLTLPGMIAVAVAESSQRPSSVAAALQQLLQKTLAQRHALLGREEKKDTHRPPNHEHGDGPEGEGGGWWWWLGRRYAVAVVGNEWEQQRVKLLYTKALREATAHTQAELRRAAQDLHHARCLFESSESAAQPSSAASPPPSSSTSLPRCSTGGRYGREHLPPSALPFTAAVPNPPRVFVLPSPLDELAMLEPQPPWLNYTGELPPHINPDASRVACAIGRWSFFLYDNYRLWMNWFMAALPGGAYQDHFLLGSMLLSDLADHRISIRDFIAAH